MPKRKNIPLELRGDVTLLNSRQQSFTAAQVQLLTAIGECGSISTAARQVGISYKTAWDRVDAMNNLAERPLVVRSSGGAGGGGTSLTADGKRLIEGFAALAEEHEAFLQRMGSQLKSFGDVADFVRGATVISSARNQYRGVVSQISRGAVNAEVTLAISEAQSITATITLDSVKQLKLKKGSRAVALIKSSWIILSKDTAVATSARNKLCGTVLRIVKGAVNSEVTIDLGAGKSICAIVTNASVSELKLRKNDTACALFKASSVILMKE